MIDLTPYEPQAFTMAISIKTKNADALMARILSAMERGDFPAWEKHASLERITHNSASGDADLRRKAWLIPTAKPSMVEGEPDVLVWRIKFACEPKDEDRIFASYHSRFVEMLLSNFKGDITRMTVLPALSVAEFKLNGRYKSFDH